MMTNNLIMRYLIVVGMAGMMCMMCSVCFGLDFGTNSEAYLTSKGYVDEMDNYITNLINTNVVQLSLYVKRQGDSFTGRYAQVKTLLVSETNTGVVIHDDAPTVSTGTITPDTSWDLNAIIGHSWDFNGVGYITMPHKAEIPIAAQGRSFSFWVYPKSTADGPKNILYYGDNTGQGRVIIRIYTLAGEHKLQFGSDGIQDLAVLPQNEWTHCVIYKIPSAPHWYGWTNGVRLDIHVHAATLNTVDDTPMTIGGIEGNLDELSIWNTELTTNEVLALYNNGAGMQLAGNEVGLCGSWTFDNDAAFTDKGVDFQVNGSAYVTGTLKTDAPIVLPEQLATKQYVDAAILGDSSTILPYSDNTGYLGTNDYRWKEVHAVDVYSDNVTGTGIVRTANVITDVMWDDLVVPGMALATGSGAPSLIDTGTGSGVKGMGYDNTDSGHGVVQMPHGLALTNETRATLYIEPHVHWSVGANPGAGSTNIRFRLIWEWANLNSVVTHMGTQIVTHTGGIVMTNSYITSFGNVTNDGAGISSVFRFQFSRPSSGANDYDARAIIDQIDMHVPTDRRGSSQIYQQ